MSLQQHVSDDDVEKYVLELELTPQEADQIRMHVSICTLCSLKLDWTQEYVRAMGPQLRALHGQQDG